MTRFFVPRKAGPRETMAALAVALGIGGLSFYLVRMLLARDSLESKAPTHMTGELENPPGAKTLGDQGARQ
jgi:hypothetical protein